MKQGDIVKFKEESENEKKLRESGIKMCVVWADAPRAMVEFMHPTNPLWCTQIFNIEDVEVIE